MRVPIKLTCTECPDVLDQVVLHSIIGGHIFRFCSESCRAAHGRRFTQVTMTGGLEEQKQPAR
jgi:hypothetical protein